MSPLISIVIPVYNTESYLCNCIESVINQTFTSWELVLVDDGSTDGSGEICDAYALKDIRISVIHQNNMGVSNARYVGITRVSGDYLMFVDSDDYLCEKALATFMENMSDEIGLLVSGTVFNNEIISEETYIKRILLGDLSGCVWGKLFRRVLFKDYVQDIERTVDIGEDQLLNLKLALKNHFQVKCIVDNIYNYRCNLSSVTSTKPFSLEYEEFFMAKRLKILGISRNKYSHELCINNLKTLENLVVCRVKVPYNRPWIKELFSWSEGKKIGIRYRLLLYFSNNKVCKYLLAVDKRIRNVMRISHCFR